MPEFIETQVSDDHLLAVLFRVSKKRKADVTWSPKMDLLGLSMSLTAFV